MIAEANLIQFKAEKDIMDLNPIPKEILPKMTLSQLEDLKQRWWWLFSHSAECRGVSYMKAFITIMDQLGQGDGKGPGKKHVHHLHLNLMLEDDAAEQYRIVWKDKVVLSYLQKKFVPGVEWMKEFDDLYLRALDAVQEYMDRREESTRQALLEELVVE